MSQPARTPKKWQLPLGPALLVVVFGGYFAAYAVLHEQSPVYYSGNRPPKQIAITLTEPSQTAGVQPVATTPRVPDAYRLRYRLKGKWVETLFAPAHWIDRKVRPHAWPTIDWSCIIIDISC